MKIMGIDIGTTTVSVVMTDTETGKLLARETVEHNSFLQSSKPEQKLQDPERIYEIVRELLIKQQKENGLPDGIGFTGQMHGMLYVDASGKAVSPLYTWQDGSGEIPLENGKTCAELLQGVGAAASGYGVVTHFYLQNKGQIPKDAVRMTTISDYIAMRLCENTVPVIGLDMAASWGCFDLQKQEFLYEALEQAEKFVEKYGKEAAWKVDTAFSGTRSDPSHRGTIAGIGVENFHPGALTVGVICGILNELHEQYEQMCQLTGKKATRLTGSGNGIRRNPLMRRLAEEMFKMPMEIPEYEEEAAYGAVLTAGKLVAAM